MILDLAIAFVAGAFVAVALYHFGIVRALQAEKDRLRAEVHTLYVSLGNLSKL